MFSTGQWTNPLNISRQAWIFLGLSGIATGASWVCFYRALKVGEASKVLVVDKFSIVLVAIFALLFLGEKTLIKDWVGIGLVTVGLIIIATKF